MKFNKTQKAVIGVLVFIVIVVAFAEAGARINTSPSLAVGLYWYAGGEPGKGSYVTFCPPKNELFDEALRRGYFSVGSCPGDYGYLLKKVLGIQGDTVSVDESGVYVNGELLPFSAPKTSDRSGNAMWNWEVKNYRLKEGELLLMTDVSPESFDSRYFGPILRKQVKDVVRPVFTW
jgi:conjugative transfer signal peptidase TraF